MGGKCCLIRHGCCSASWAVAWACMHGGFSGLAVGMHESATLLVVCTLPWGLS